MINSVWVVMRYFNKYGFVNWKKKIITRKFWSGILFRSVCAFSTPTLSPIHVIVQEKIVKSGSCIGLTRPLQYQHPKWSTALALLLNQLPANMSRKAMENEPDCLGPCQPLGRSRLRSRLLTAACQTNLWKNELEYEKKKKSLPLSLSFYIILYF